MKPLRCKICSSILQETPIIIGEKPEERKGKTAFVILSHMQEMQTKEHNGNGPKPILPTLFYNCGECILPFLRFTMAPIQSVISAFVNLQTGSIARYRSRT